MGHVWVVSSIENSSHKISYFSNKGRGGYRWKHARKMEPVVSQTRM